MVRYTRQTISEPCPFLEEEDRRCASHFTLGHLSQAFNHCLNGYRACPIYHELARERPPRLMLTAVTHDGQPLQQTGT